MRPLNLIALLVFLGATVWVFTLSEPIVRKVQQGFYTLIAPILKAGSSTEQFARAMTQEVTHSEDLAVLLERAEKERDLYKLTASRVRALEEEVADLRSALNFTQQAQFDLVPARVIRRNPLTWSSTVTIDSGKNKRITDDLPVVGGNGGLVGRVYNSVESLANVLLITDEASKVSAQVRGSPEKGIVTGQLTTYGQKPILRLLYLSNNAALTPGMTVSTDGRGKLFPPNIPIGKILSYSSGPEYGEAVIDPVVDFNQLTTIFAIPGSAD